jgi:hypothetical protein
MINSIWNSHGFHWIPYGMQTYPYGFHGTFQVDSMKRFHMDSMEQGSISMGNSIVKNSVTI